MMPSRLVREPACPTSTVPAAEAWPVFKEHIHPSDLALFSRDLDTCQRVFDRIRTEFGIEPKSGGSDLVAANIIRLYKSGVTDEIQLLALAREAAEMWCGPAAEVSKPPKNF